MKVENEEIKQERYLTIVKSNDLIQKSRYNLSVVEQKIVLYMISKLDTLNDNQDNEIEFSLSSFCKVCGIDAHDNISQLKEVIQELANKSLWIKTERKGKPVETLIRWIEKPYLEKDNSKITIRLDRDLMPYLLELKGNFTKYQLIAILALKSKYSIRMYEILKSYAYKGKQHFTVEELRKILDTGNKYQKVYEFRRNVIDIAVEEINKFTDLEVDYTICKEGRSITGFIFTISQEDAVFDGAELYLEKIIPTRNSQNKRFKEVMKDE